MSFFLCIENSSGQGEKVFGVARRCSFHVGRNAVDTNTSRASPSTRLAPLPQTTASFALPLDTRQNPLGGWLPNDSY